jgi:hypothetical protein
MGRAASPVGFSCFSKDKEYVMGPAEFNRLLSGSAHGRQAELNQVAATAGPAHAAGSPPGDGTDGPGANWESAWIDLGGEG